MCHTYNFGSSRWTSNRLGGYTLMLSWTQLPFDFNNCVPSWGRVPAQSEETPFVFRTRLHVLGSEFALRPTKPAISQRSVKWYPARHGKDKALTCSSTGCRKSLYSPKYVFKSLLRQTVEVECHSVTYQKRLINVVSIYQILFHYLRTCRSRDAVSALVCTRGDGKFVSGSRPTYISFPSHSGLRTDNDVSPKDKII